MLKIKLPMFPLRLMQVASVIILVTVISIILFPAYHKLGGLIQLQNLLNGYSVQFFILRMLILIVFFMTWPAFVRYRARRFNWPPSNIQRAMDLRYGIVAFLAFLEFIFNGGYV